MKNNKIIDKMGNNQDKLLQAIMDTKEITWHSLINEVIKQEDMDPWDIDISNLTQKYIEIVKKLKEFDFRLSGKVVLATAILLKIKSNKLIDEDIDELTRLIEAKEENMDNFYEDLEGEMENKDKEYLEDQYGPLLPRTPQPRKRKVSINELISALQKALEVKERRVLRELPEVTIEKPTKKIDITKIIGQTYKAILGIGRDRTHFEEIIPSQEKEDKYTTFISLLYLAHVDQRKINLHQEKNFGKIEIEVLEKED